MFDFPKTLRLIKGGLLEPQATWTSFLAEKPDLKKTFMVLTGPLIVANVVLGVIFSRLAGGYYMNTYGGNFFTALIMGLVMALIFFAIASFVISTLAAVFEGKSDIGSSFAALSLAAIPGYLGAIVAALIPYIGWLIALAAGILSLVYLYRILPLALDIPEEKRTVHYVVSLVVIVVVNMIVGVLLGVGAATSSFDKPFSAADSDCSAAGEQCQLLASAWSRDAGSDAGSDV